MHIFSTATSRKHLSTNIIFLLVTSAIAKYRNECHKLLTRGTFPLILNAILVKNHT